MKVGEILMEISLKMFVKYLRPSMWRVIDVGRHHSSPNLAPGKTQSLSSRRLLSWINHLPPACWSTFRKSTFKQQLGCRFDIMDSISSFCCILTYAIIYVLIHHIVFRLYLFFLNIVLYFFKYSCTNIFHRRSLYTFYCQATSANTPRKIIFTFTICIS